MTDPVQTQWENKVTSLVLERLAGKSGLLEDPDHLITGEIVRLLSEQGWLVIPAHSSLELRLAYEQEIRSISIANVRQYLFLLSFPIDGTPFDIFNSTEHIAVKIKDFISTLSYEVLKQLPVSWMPVIYNNLPPTYTHPKQWDKQQTVSFILDSCLNLDISPHPTPVELLGMLADIVLYNLELPPVLVKSLLERLGAVWPGDFSNLISSPTKAREFLQQAWQNFLGVFAQDKYAVAEGGSDVLSVATEILARDRGFQGKISALLAENLIAAPTIQAGKGMPDWVRPGVHFHLDRMSYLKKRLDQLTNQVPGEDATANTWSEFAWGWAAWRREYFQNNKYESDIQPRQAGFQLTIEESFLRWLLKSYPILISQPYLPAPVMVHQALHYVAARYHPDQNQPLAFIVIDGMAIEDWLAIRQEWVNLPSNWLIEEHSLFALTPTITPVSRQALLSGKLPRNFVGNWLSTQTEEAAWRIFWEEHGVHPSSISYQRGLGNQHSGQTAVLEDEVESILQQPHPVVTALVINTIDNLMHNNILGSAAFLQQVSIWSNQGYLRLLVSRLLEDYQMVILTSDHGHLEGQGIGDIALKDAAVERSLRARIFSDKSFEKIIKNRTDVLQWPLAGLPQNASVIIPQRIGLFASPGTVAISHGGAALEEVIVPFIMITRKPA